MILPIPLAAVPIDQPHVNARAVQRFLELRPEFVGAQAQLAYLRMRACDWRFYQDEEDALLALVRQGIADVAPFMLLSRAGDRLRLMRWPLFSSWADCAGGVTRHF